MINSTNKKYLRVINNNDLLYYDMFILNKNQINNLNIDKLIFDYEIPYVMPLKYVFHCKDDIYFLYKIYKGIQNLK